MVKSQLAASRVLIVEDDGLLAMTLADALRDAGVAAVDHCADTAAAIALLGTLQPTVLVLDVNLADRDDGWALAELAVQISPQRPLIVFATGAPERVPERARVLGEVLAKPFSAADLLEIILVARGNRGLLGRVRSLLGD